jgi:hypothetical protein
MGTKNTTTSTNQYNPQSLSTYQALQGPSSNAQQGFISTPYNNSTYNAQKAQGGILNTAAQAGRAGVSSNQAGALGTGQGAQVGLGLSNNLTNSMTSGRTNSALMMGAAQLRQQALGSAMNYRPLQTGGTQTQTTGGLGTWLAPIIGGVAAAAKGASSFFSPSNPGSGPGGTGPNPAPTATGDALYAPGGNNPFGPPPSSPFFGGN